MKLEKYLEKSKKFEIEFEANFFFGKISNKMK